MLATQWMWDTLAARNPTLVTPSPPPLKRGQTAATSDRCCLCGGPCDPATAFPRTFLPDTFTNWNLCAVPVSGALCPACIALTQLDTWTTYAQSRTDLDLLWYKKPVPAKDDPTRMEPSGGHWNWYSFSHCFTAAAHEIPDRARIRALLLDPPPPPFVLVLTTSGKKHLLFRAAIAHDRDHYPVQVEEATVYVDRARLTACFAAFEALYALGFSRDAILTGEYHPAQRAKTGARVWRPLEDAVRPYREQHMGLMTLAHFCVQHPDGLSIVQREETTND